MRSPYNHYISTIPSRLHYVGICRLPSHRSFGLAPRVRVVRSYESSRDYMQRVITYSVSELFADDYKWALPATRQAFQFATLHITSFFLTFLLPFLLTYSPSSPLPSPQQQHHHPHHPHHHTTGAMAPQPEPSGHSFPDFADGDVRVVLTGSRQYRLHSGVLKNSSSVM